ncbi:IS5 family transposase [Georgenia sp. AZ-5]|uniref:IS5 family transposase n=1 Tax=Georgenia sp. AZ-5 TaxID=3367526 RepID=UPI0037541A4D
MTGFRVAREEACAQSSPASSRRSGPPSPVTCPPGHRTATPLGCHRRRVPDRLCFSGILTRLVTGCSWHVAAYLTGGVSETTLRARRTEWLAAGVFDKLLAEALAAYDRIIGLNLADVAVDGSLHKAPCGGEGTGPNPTDRGKLGWKWSIATERWGIPIGWTIAGANRHDAVLLEPTLQAVLDNGLLAEVGTVHLDRGYDSPATLQRATELGVGDINCAKKRPPGSSKTKTKTKLKLGLRWPVERTNSWFTNFGQLRRNTDRYEHQRLGQIALAVALILTVKLTKWAKRWNT